MQRIDSPTSPTPKRIPTTGAVYELVLSTTRRLAASDQLDRTQVYIHRSASEQDLAEFIGFSPLRNPIDGSRYGEPYFKPFWSSFEDHGGWFEMTVPIGKEGFTVVLFIADARTTDPELRAMAHEYAVPAIAV
jgi:hypothetical protein